MALVKPTKAKTTYKFDNPHLLHSLKLSPEKINEDMVILDNSWWYLHVSRYQKNPEFKAIFAALVETSCMKLFLSNNRNASILKEVTHAQYSKLTKIDINHNDITSIQGLRKLRAPFLESIDLSANDIVNIRGLTATTFPNLKYVDLDQNYFKEDSTINRMNTHVATLELNLEGKYVVQRVYPINLAVFIKVRSLDLKLRVSGREKVRMTQTRVVEMLKKKSVSCTIELNN